MSGLYTMFVKLLMAAMAMVGLHDPNEKNLIPTVNLSAIRYISCDDWTGSGYLIADRTLVTDYHVASGTHCVDASTGTPLTTYKVDHVHDLALMVGNYPSLGEYYIKISCEPMKAHKSYAAYGITGFMSSFDFFRQVKEVFTGKHMDVNYGSEEGPGIVPHQAVMAGASVPGMSGGPVIDPETGLAHGQVEGGDMDPLGIPMGKSFVTELHDTILCQK